MPFIPHTPESMSSGLLRSDSKNPGVTCRGITNSGLPCRRALSKSPKSSPASSPGASSPSVPGYCWQHGDQAQSGASPQGLQSQTIRERTSLDTLVDRLGLLELKQRKDWKEKRKPVQQKPNPEKPSLVQDRPILPSRHKRPKPCSNLALLCCIGEVDEERKPPRQARPAEGRTTASVPTRPSIKRDPFSRTHELLSLIPSSASPQTTALLLAELAKPISENDDEGYIYMFWLTPDTLPSTPPSEAATSLLSPPSRQPPGQRRTSDVLNSFSATNSNKKTILLKIGRAQNVQRRLNQWTRQCGYNLSLIRYYPYYPSPSSTSVNKVPRTPRKVPNAHKVERLIHIELDGKRAQGSGKCGACSREHREWFEVEASREGVKTVDEVVRRWVDWGITNAH